MTVIRFIRTLFFINLGMIIESFVYEIRFRGAVQRAEMLDYLNSGYNGYFAMWGLFSMFSLLLFGLYWFYLYRQEKKGAAHR